ncbi:MAG: GNAT family N-acetyltransferase [Pirellulales bacterium]|nr:GNAT family N-acetyltransferase [Pirellulales bacterium]
MAKPLNLAPRVEEFPLPEAEVASAADHAAVHQFLMAVFQGPSRDGFFALLEDPFYEPNERVLLKIGSQILGHAQTAKRTMRFGGTDLPVATLHWLGTLPEYRLRGVAQRLLAAAEREMKADQSLAAFLVTRVPQVFRRQGWAVCGAVSCSQANTRDLLAQLSALGRGGTEWKLNIRPWRHVEMPALMRIYAQNTDRAHGPLERTEAYWRWLISRKHFDQIHVAIDGPDRLELEEGDSPIVGYVVMRQDKIVELMAAPHHPTAALELLARACGEAIERDYHAVTYHGPADSPLHGLFQQARGGMYAQPQQVDYVMARLFDPVAVLEKLPDVFQARLAASGERSLELGLQIDGARMQLVVSRRGTSVVAGRLGRSYLSCSMREFTRLVFGQLDVHEAVAQQRIETSTRVAADVAAALFPRLPLWRSPLDDLAC